MSVDLSTLNHAVLITGAPPVRWFVIRGVICLASFGRRASGRRPPWRLLGESRGVAGRCTHTSHVAHVKYATGCAVVSSLDLWSIGVLCSYSGHHASGTCHCPNAVHARTRAYRKPCNRMAAREHQPWLLPQDPKSGWELHAWVGWCLQHGSTCRFRC